MLPSLPGYGFSGEPAELGWDAGRVARAWAELMRRLGYTRYVAQGGDVGAPVTDLMGRQAVEGSPGYHLNLLTTVLAMAVPRPGSAQERAAPEALTTFKESGFGYFLEMATRPQTIGYALLDSPVALAAWMLDHDTDSYYKISRAFVDGQPVGNLTREHVVDNITLYWLTGTGRRRPGRTGRTGGRWPQRCERPGSPGGLGPGRLHHVPGRVWAAPRSWVEAFYPTSATSTRPTGAATSPPGRSRNSSRPSSGPRSARCADDAIVFGSRARHLQAGTARALGPIGDTQGGHNFQRTVGFPTG